MPRPVQTRACSFPDARLRPLSGVVELDLGRVRTAGSRPERVSALLATAFDAIDGEPVDTALVDCLSSGTREWLAQSAVAGLAGTGQWFETECTACGEPIDIALQLADAPRKEAGTSFPVIAVKTSAGTLEFECPNGRHERYVAALPAEADLRRELIRLCALDDETAEKVVGLAETDLDGIEAAMEDSAPDVADRTQTACHACGHQSDTLIDPLALPLTRPRDVLRDVGDIASAYGWSEREILDLPTDRRRTYSRMIRDARREGPR